MKDLAAAQFNWTPPGSANPISAIFVHFLNSEDAFVQTQMQAKPKIWDQGGWAEKTGVKVPPGYSGGWEEVKHMTLALEPLLAYQQAVRLAIRGRGRTRSTPPRKETQERSAHEVGHGRRGRPGEHGRDRVPLAVRSQEDADA
jgi:hypothetical protein